MTSDRSSPQSDPKAASTPTSSGAPKFSLLGAVAEVNSLLKTVVSLIVAGLASALAFVGYQAYYAPDPDLDAKVKEVESLQAVVNERDKTIESLSAVRDELTERVDDQQEQIHEQQQELERLDLAVRLLKVDRRVARIEVLDQQLEEGGAVKATTVAFVELDAAGEPLAEPRRFTIEGDVLHVDAWVAKFQDELVQSGDPLKAASLYLFRRLYGDYQRPVDGFPLDEERQQPAPYSGGSSMGEFEQGVWREFWEYATDEAKAAAAGIRAAHGEAPYIKLTPGKRYRLELRASDGLSIVPEDADG